MKLEIPPIPDLIPEYSNIALLVFMVAVCAYASVIMLRKNK